HDPPRRGVRKAVGNANRELGTGGVAAQFKHDPPRALPRAFSRGSFYGYARVSEHWGSSATLYCSAASRSMSMPGATRSMPLMHIRARLTERFSIRRCLVQTAGTAGRTFHAMSAA